MAVVRTSPEVMQRKKLQPAHCSECGDIVATIKGDVLVIFGRHHGRHHETLIPIIQLAMLLEPIDKGRHTL